jgi:hypothetical protein
MGLGVTARADYLDQVWIVRTPDSDAPDAGYTVWARDEGIRICWVGNLPDSEAIANAICESHNHLAAERHYNRGGNR